MCVSHSLSPFLSKKHMMTVEANHGDLTQRRGSIFAACICPETFRMLCKCHICTAETSSAAKLLFLVVSSEYPSSSIMYLLWRGPSLPGIWLEIYSYYWSLTGLPMNVIQTQCSKSVLHTATEFQLIDGKAEMVFLHVAKKNKPSGTQIQPN